MELAVASGKGGTGKTTVAVCLAHALGERGEQVTYIDCDVEEPNGHIFLNPTLDGKTPVEVRVPAAEPAKCTGCGLCSEFCQFNALLPVRDGVLVFPDLCHGCGGCTLVCPEEAIHEVAHEIGLVETGRAGAIGFVRGTLSVGKPLATPVIGATREKAPPRGIVIIDAPPGTSCPVVEAIHDVDHVLLVTEPTPFGLHDLDLAVRMVRELDVPASVIVNRCDVGGSEVRDFAKSRGLPVLAEIRDDRALAEAYARGELPSKASRALGDAVATLADRFLGALQGSTA
jgi:MinD superfamily P-loop ATPase